MVTATASVTPTKMFLNRWVKQLVPELVKMKVLSESGVPVVTHWLEATITELESSLYGKMPSVETAPRISPSLEPVQKAADDGPWSPERILKELVESPLVTHVAFGAIPTARGHRVQGVLGAGDSNVVNFANSELQKKGLFMESWDNYFEATFNKDPFKARLTAPLRVGNNIIIKMCYNDYTGDSREGGHTNYTVGFPSDWGPKVIPTIVKSPEVLILAFQRMFPNMDRSRGQLRMDPNWKTYYFKCAEYDQQKLWPAIDRLNWH